MIGVPLFATQAHQPIQPIIHPQTMPGYQVISPPSTVQPSAIYYQPMIPPSAPASHAIVTPMESPVKHFSDSSTKLHHASVDSRYHPYRRGGSFTPSSAATPTTDAGSQEDKRRIAAEKMAAAAQKALMYSLSMESQAAASAAEGGGQRKRELQQQRRELRRRQPASPKVKHDTPVSNPSHSSDSIAARDSLSSGTPASVGTPSTSSQHLRKSRPNHVSICLLRLVRESH
ncbi:hypothetical protein BC830DRAFT_396571 [Chytriomyces sp. MP71]|nr:hypothetical protein BC830DRAFT_396571 [Chytriomyces sp. MP71]